jgi:predicted nucleic acid-binding protein
MSFGGAPRAVVVDASVAVGFVRGDAGWTERWIEWAESGAIVVAPPHFPAEVANALLRSVKLPAAEVALQLDRLFRSGIDAVRPEQPALLEAVSLADQHRLTVYDALYLQLALDLDAELATLDGDLIAAARAEDIDLVDASR